MNNFVSRTIVPAIFCLCATTGLLLSPGTALAEEPWWKKVIPGKQQGSEASEQEAEQPAPDNQASGEQVSTEAQEAQGAASAAAQDPKQAPGEGGSQPPVAPELEDVDEVAMATEHCILAGEEETAAGIAVLFAGDEEQALVNKDLSRYLVGLCIPSDLESQYALNQYLIAKGANSSFFAERTLEELARFLDEAGVELGIKYEALEKDGKLKRKLKKDNDIKKAEFILKQDNRYTEQVDLFAPAIAELKDEQRQQALEIAARARAHALNASYFLSRALYVSSEISESVAVILGLEAADLAAKASASSQQSVTRFATDMAVQARGVFNKQNRDAARFSKFIASNGEAMAGALTNAVNVVKSFQTDVPDVPSLDQEAVDEDVARLSDAWDFPAEFEDEDAFGPNNTVPAA